MYKYKIMWKICVRHFTRKKKLRHTWPDLVGGGRSCCCVCCLESWGHSPPPRSLWSPGCVFMLCGLWMLCSLPVLDSPGGDDGRYEGDLGSPQPSARGPWRPPAAWAQAWTSLGIALVWRGPEWARGVCALGTLTYVTLHLAHGASLRHPLMGVDLLLLL